MKSMWSIRRLIDRSIDWLIGFRGGNLTVGDGWKRLPMLFWCYVIWLACSGVVCSMFRVLTGRTVARDVQIYRFIDYIDRGLTASAFALLVLYEACCSVRFDPFHFDSVFVPMRFLSICMLCTEPDDLSMVPVLCEMKYRSKRSYADVQTLGTIWISRQGIHLP